MFWEAVRDVKEDHNFNYTSRSSMSDVDHEKDHLFCLPFDYDECANLSTSREDLANTDSERSM